MKRILLVAALGAALGLGSSSFAAPYVGGGVGYSSAYLGIDFFGQVGDWNMLGENLGLRGRLGGASVLGLFGLTVGLDVTYNLGRVFSPDVPLSAYVVGGPGMILLFTPFGTGFGGLVGAGGGLEFAFNPNVGAFLEMKPLGIAFGAGGVVYNFSFSSGVNFRF